MPKVNNSRYDQSITLKMCITNHFWINFGDFVRGKLNLIATLRSALAVDEHMLPASLGGDAPLPLRNEKKPGSFSSPGRKTLPGAAGNAH